MTPCRERFPDRRQMCVQMPGGMSVTGQKRWDIPQSQTHWMPGVPLPTAMRLSEQHLPPSSGRFLSLVPAQAFSSCLLKIRRAKGADKAVAVSHEVSREGTPGGRAFLRKASSAHVSLPWSPRGAHPQPAGSLRSRWREQVSSKDKA